MGCRGRQDDVQAFVIRDGDRIGLPEAGSTNAGGILRNFSIVIL